MGKAVNVRVSPETIARVGTLLPDGCHYVLIVLSGTKATIGSNIEDSGVAKRMALEVLNTSWDDEDESSSGPRPFAARDGRMTQRPPHGN